MGNSGKETSRRYPLKMPPNWEPPYPSFESEYAIDKTDLSLVVFGAQCSAADKEKAFAFATGLTSLTTTEGRVDHVDISFCEKDSAGLVQYVVTAYWFDPIKATGFMESSGFKAFWARNSADGLGYGIFREVFNLPLDRFETLHSGPDHVVGIANTREGVSPPIDRHAYWGSMRDRIPASSHDRFDSNEDIQIIEQSENHIVVKPNKNLAIIRSGQDLRPASGKERAEYFADIEPVLIKGMNFLRDKGVTINCYDCRFMQFVDQDGNPTEHTFGFSYFRTLEDLERWAEFHPTHLAIFNAFLDFAPGYGSNMMSRFWHEVSVLPVANQYAEYINCAPETGLMSALS